MTEDQITPLEDTPETAEAPTAAKEAVDPARQAELDALAAELQGKAPAKKPVRKSRRVTVQDPNELPAEAPEAGATETPAAEGTPAGEEPAEAAPAKRTSRTTKTTAKRGTSAAAKTAAAAESAESEAELDETATEPDQQSGRAKRSVKAETAATDSDATADDATAEVSAEPAADSPENQDASETADGDAADGDGEGSGRSRSRSRRGRSRSGGTTAEAPADAEDGSGRGRGRGRGRNGGRLGDDVEPEILPDDVLLPIAGILDVLDNYAFVRTTGYLAGVTDVYVSLGQVKKYGLRKGDAVVGAIRQPRDGEQHGRQKYNALVKVDSVNGVATDASATRTEFEALTPVRPTAALASDTMRGQRAVVIGATGAGKTQRVAKLAAEVSAAQPDGHLMVILVAPRPEEITEFRRAVKGEVVVSGLELSAEDHVTVVELAVERAKRLVELGIDVVVLIDSITQLGRAYASLAPGARGVLDDPSIALPAKRLLGAARATEEGASLTIVATASAETPLDRLVATELAAIANATVQL